MNMKKKNVKKMYREWLQEGTAMCYEKKIFSECFR